MEIPYGSCVSWRVPPKLNGFFEKIFGWLQNKVTGMPETHSSMIMSKYIEINNRYYEYELTVTARVSTFTPGQFTTIYDILAPLEIKVSAMERLRKETEGNFYAIWQTVIFLVRRILEEFGKDGRRIWNPLKWLGICSEGQYKYLYFIAESMKWYDLTHFMDQWNPDVFHAGDARIVLDWMVIRGYAKIIYPTT
jgi:hypothetical protein